MNAGLEVAVAILSVMYGGAMVSAFMAWRNIRRRHPEVTELRHIGWFTTLTAGLLALTAWLPVLFNAKQLKEDPNLRRTLYRPLMVWMGTFIAGLLATLLLPAHTSTLIAKVLGKLDLAAAVALVVSSWKSADPLLRSYGRRNLLTVLPVIAIIILYAVADPGHIAGDSVLVALLALIVLVWVTVYLLTWQGLALLTAGSRGAPELRKKLWLHVVPASALVIGAPFLAEWLHKIAF